MFTSEKKLDTIEGPQNNHTIGDQGGSWTTSLKSVWVQCFNGVLTRHPIFWEKIHFEKSESTNLHKHQKKTKWKWRKHRQAPKKNKETFQQLWAHFWVGAGNSVFFLCLCRFGASSGLVFFVFFGACQCFVKSESPNLQRHQKNKTNKVEVEETSTGTKNKKKQTFQQLWAHFWIGAEKFRFVFFVPVQVWCIQWFGVLLFLLCLPMFFFIYVTSRS